MKYCIKKISFFNNTFSDVSQNIPINNILTAIKAEEYYDKIHSLRQLLAEGNIDEYKRNKIQLPAVTFCGTFSKKRKQEELLEYSSILIFDVDNINEVERERLKLFLSSQPYVYAYWISPSMNGIKFLIPTDSNVDMHKLYFCVIKKYIEDYTSIPIDKSGSDYTRLCYVSSDKDLFINENASTITKDWILKHNDIPTIDTISRSQKGNTSKESYALPKSIYATEGKNDKRMREAMFKIIKFLKKKNKSITTDYESWYKVGMAIANTFSYDVGSKYYLELCRLDGALHDEKKSEQMLLYCYENRIPDKISFATIIFFAKNQGYNSQ
ncbi:BT4734/BF3469 family protein [Chitinophagaceae bacterium MMS25-I14]